MHGALGGAMHGALGGEVHGDKLAFPDNGQEASSAWFVFVYCVERDFEKWSSGVEKRRKPILKLDRATIVAAYFLLVFGIVSVPFIFPSAVHDLWLSVRTPESLVQASKVIGQCRKNWEQATFSGYGIRQGLVAQSRFERKRVSMMAKMEDLQEKIEQRLDRQMAGSARSIIATVRASYEQGIIISSYEAGEACKATGRRGPYEWLTR